MSLFPAYNEKSVKNSYVESDVDVEAAATAKNVDESKSSWLENSSFNLANEISSDSFSLNKDSETQISFDSDSSVSKADEDIQNEVKVPEKKKLAKFRSHSKKCKKTKSDLVVLPTLEFCGNDDFYIDKKPTKQYFTLRTLHKPGCPRYRCKFRRKLGWRNENTKNKIKRYYHQPFDGSNKITNEVNEIAFHENDYTLLMRQFGKKTIDTPNVLEVWLDMINLQDRNPYRWSRLLLAEKKIDLILRALHYHPKSKELFHLYIEIVTATYPACEVSKKIDDLLNKDQYNYILWTGQIMATQGTMARCIVPDVLRIYERCMQRMYNAKNIDSNLTEDDNKNSDEVMMKLFYNCALFLRQAGLYEQFFALIKLALDLNISTNQFGNFVAQEKDEQTLVEYEELILHSGLPMNEIWLRIEKLRQGFNFFPCPEHMKCSDPQRIVFNEDVCHYVYPLKSNDNSFYMMLLMLGLLKLPFVQSDGLAEKFCARLEHIGDSDAIEDVLSICIPRTYALKNPNEHQLLIGVCDLAKEMVINPTFLSNCIGHEMYMRCITDFLLNSANVFTNTDERKRIVFILLWCRFERLLLILQKYSKKLNNDYVKSGRSRFKNLLKKDTNRNVLNFYTELALYEYEALDSYEIEKLLPIKNIFENLIITNTTEETLSSDLCHTVVTYVEILIGNNLHKEAFNVLISYVMCKQYKSDMDSVSSATKMSALQKIKDKLENLIKIEANIEIMVIEQFLLPDNIVCLIKVYVYMHYLNHQKLDAISFLNKLLKIFICKNDRHKYLRENIYEILIITMQLPCEKSKILTKVQTTNLIEALNEFPRNMYFLLRICLLSNIPWYKIRATLLHTSPNVTSLILLIALARYRFIKSQIILSDVPSNFFLNAIKNEAEFEQKYKEKIVRNRILNVFEQLLNVRPNERKNNALHRNALFWRLYLRCLTDQNTAFETSKKCLLTALDEVPWNKALYLDGATYVPQELVHLQDLIIEKQLRICALPEELEILRENQ